MEIVNVFKISGTWTYLGLLIGLNPKEGNARVPLAPRPLAPLGGLLLELIPGLLVRFNMTLRKQDFSSLKTQAFFDTCRSRDTFTYFDLSAPKERFIQRHGSLNRIFVSKFNIGKTFRLAIPFVAEYSNSINGTTTMEMLF